MNLKLTKQPTHYLPLISVLFCFLIGDLIKGPPRDPDAVFNLDHLLGTFLISIGFIVSVFAWGLWIYRKLGLRSTAIHFFPGALGFGSIFLSLLAGLLGSLGLMGYELAPLHRIILLCGCVFAVFTPPDALTEKKVPLPAREKWLNIVLIIYCVCFVLIRLTKAGLLHGGTDPEMYHLFGPRVWSESGWITPHRGWTELFVATNWEYLFLWGNSLLGDLNGKGLIEGQFFGQFIHVGLGSVLLLSALYCFLQIWVKSPFWCLLCIAVCASSESIAFNSALAKNDWGQIGWTFLGLTFLFSKDTKQIQLVLGGFILGICLTTKYTLIMPLFPILLVLAAQKIFSVGRKEGLKKIFLIGLAMVMGTFPIVLRNFAFTGNPFFPLLSNLFHNPELSDTLVTSASHFSGQLKINWTEIFGKISEAAHDTPLIVPSLLVLVLWPLGKISKLWIALYLAALASVLCFCFWHFPNGFMRWLALSLLLMSCSGVFVVQSFSNWFFSVVPRFEKFQFGFQVLCVAALLFASVPKLENEAHANLSSILEGPSPALILRSAVHEGGSARAWIRLNAKPDDFILTTGDNLFYYIYNFHVYSASEQPEIDRALKQRSMEKVLDVLRSYDVRYVLDVSRWDSTVTSLFGAAIENWAYQYPESLVYLDQYSKILDIPLLEQVVHQACSLSIPAKDSFLTL